MVEEGYDGGFARSPNFLRLIGSFSFGSTVLSIIGRQPRDDFASNLDKNGC